MAVSRNLLIILTVLFSLLGLWSLWSFLMTWSIGALICAVIDGCIVGLNWQSLKRM